MSSYNQKLEKLFTQIQASKEKIESLKNKRALEIGRLAMSSGLAELSDECFLESFASMANQHGLKRELSNEQSSETITA